MQVELITRVSPGAASGIGRYVRELHSHLSGSVQVRLVDTIDPPLSRRLSFLRSFPWGIRDHKPGSIVHFTQIMGCAQMLWHPVRPAIATVHDLGVLICPEDELLFNYFDRRILDLQFAGLKRMDHFVVNSDKTRQGLVELLGIASDRIHFVQLGVNTAHFRPIPDARPQITDRYRIRFDDDTFYLLYVGSELPRKNAGMLVEALAQLKKHGYRPRLLKVGGSGGERWRAKLLSRIEKLQMLDDVLITDYVPEDDLPLFYNAADLCVTPTLLEGGFAWLAMEAMACGKPVIATTAALIPPDVERALVLVEPNNLDEMVEAIARCINDEELRNTMGKTGHSIICEDRFSWQNTAQNLMEVYERALLEERE